MLVELKARFDERNNIKWATRLEVGRRARRLRRREPEDALQAVPGRAQGSRRRPPLRRTSAPATTTARPSQVYTDFGLFTADPEILDDVSEVFNYLTGYSQRTDYRSCWWRRSDLRAGFLALIEREIEHAKAGRPAASSSRTTR